MSGLGVKRMCYNWFYKNNAVENVLKIITAQIDTTSDLIKGYDKPLIESVKKIREVEDTGSCWTGLFY